MGLAWVCAKLDVESQPVGCQDNTAGPQVLHDLSVKELEVFDGEARK